jgi:hypothetical protein
MELLELRDVRKTYHLGEMDLQVLKGVSPFPLPKGNWWR